jgi:hypothetical protein
MDVQMGRCHALILAAAMDVSVAPDVHGMAGIFKAEELVELIDSPGTVFVGRGAPRGVPTKRIGVQTTLSRSMFANPFVVEKRGFSLGESLALYSRWVREGFRELSQEELETTVASPLPLMSEATFFETLG